MTPQLVSRFGTGFLRTEIYRHGDAHLWVRRPGPQRGRPFHPVSPRVSKAVAAVPTGPVVWRLPEESGEIRRYRAPGETSAANLALGTSGDPEWERLRRVLCNTGRALRAVHIGVSGELATEPPPGPSRLARWLRSGRGPGGAGRFHETARLRLGSRRWERALSWCEPHPGATRFLHGAPSLGCIVVGPVTGNAALLAGEELARGPAESDVGWLLGELLELRLIGETVPGLKRLSEQAGAAAAALLCGYDAPLDAGLLGRVAAVRVFTHAHDFAAYVGWADELTTYADHLVRLIDEQGGPAVPADHRQLLESGPGDN
ncbi:UNVERIFIED_ORG: hypothetical protein FHR35_004600 [Microbispora rosea subsp. rosea]